MPAVEGRHPLGPAWGPPERTCADCAWSVLRGPGPKVLRCRAAGHERVQPDWRACARHEAPLDCLACAACCGPAYDAVEVAPRDPVKKKRPDLLATVDGRTVVPRTPDNWCSCILPDKRCTMYEDRPRCCREFARHGANCLFARRRLGLSPPWGGD